ncbi:MAG: zinc-ribbon domain-containing protein [Treponema sp.]|nr:zinc-ribbon domain-containing protein [Treponema sp.]
MKICLKCNHENKDTSKFCEECGTKLVDAPKFCPECGIKLTGTPKFCPECGTKIGNISEVTPVMDENETDVIITSDFESYDTIIPYDGDRNYMDMWNAIAFGDIEKAKELIDSGEEDDYSIFVSDVHNVKMLEFLWDYGNFNLYDENDDLLSRVIYKYSSDLNDYRKNPEYDFSSHGDVYTSEDDIHNKYLGIIKFLLEKHFDVSETLSYNETLLMKAIDNDLVKLAYYLIEEWNADVNYVPAIDNGQKLESPLILACRRTPENDILFKEKRFLCKYLIKKGANVNYQSVRLDPCGDLEYTTPLDSVLEKISFLEFSTAYEDDIKTKNIDESLYILELLVKNNAKPSEESINTIRDFKSHDLKEKVRILLHLTREQVA